MGGSAGSLERARRLMDGSGRAPAVVRSCALPSCQCRQIDTSIVRQDSVVGFFFLLLSSSLGVGFHRWLDLSGRKSDRFNSCWASCWASCWCFLLPSPAGSELPCLFWAGEGSGGKEGPAVPKMGDRRGLAQKFNEDEQVLCRVAWYGYSVSSPGSRDNVRASTRSWWRRWRPGPVNWLLRLGRDRVQAR